MSHPVMTSPNSGDDFHRSDVFPIAFDVDDCTKTYTINVYYVKQPGPTLHLVATYPNIAASCNSGTSGPGTVSVDHKVDANADFGEYQIEITEDGNGTTIGGTFNVVP